MAQSNYKPWEIDIKDFSLQKNPKEQIRFLVRFALLAPSSHNSQPWKFIVREDGVDVLPEFKRSLPEGDPVNRELYVSIGCAAENILIAADFFGYETFYLATPEKISLQLKKIREEKNDPNHLIFAIPKRHTSRAKYFKGPSEEFIQSLQKQAEDIIATPIVGDKKDAVAQIAVQADIESMESTKFRRELSQHLKHNRTSSQVGMPGFSLELPPPVAFIAPLIIRFANMAKADRKKNQTLLTKFTPVFVVLSAKDDPEHWLKAGMCYQKISLHATQEGMSTAPWGAPIEIGEAYRKLQQAVGLQERPIMLFRLGVPEHRVAPSPRLSLEDVCQ